MVNASLRWLNIVRSRYLVRIHCFLLVSGVWDISSGISPRLPLAGWLCSRYADAGGEWPIQRQPLLVQHKQQANLYLSMHNYTPLVMSRTDKKKQLTLLSQRKLALNVRNMYLALYIWSINLKNLKTRRDAYSGQYLSIFIIKSPIHLVRQSL